MSLPLQQICAAHSIIPRGVIHVGAHDGEELEEYRAMGVNLMLFIEANPAVFERLAAKVGNVPEAVAVRCAIADRDGTATLHVTSMDQSSSILPLKLHRQVYPQIHPTHTINVPCARLDSLLDKLGLEMHRFNLLHLDIQGAELLAMRGAPRTLQHIHAIRTEVNFAELYEGCPLLEEIDRFLIPQAFTRVAMETPYHPTWGEAAYVAQPIIAKSTLGRQGRFANQLLQYIFLRVYSRIHHLQVQTPDWIGRFLYGLDDAPISAELPIAAEEIGDFVPMLADPLAPDAPALRRVDLYGFFAYHTSRYALHQPFIHELLRPIGKAAAITHEAARSLRTLGRTIVALHLRRGDYTPDDPTFYSAPTCWYLDWLREIWPTLNDPVLFIASDELDTVLPDFAAYAPVSARDLNLELPEAPQFIDFHILCSCDVLAISNSTFSFVASMLNAAAATFVRPDRTAGRLVSFDPWNSLPVLGLPRAFCPSSAVT